MSDFPRGEKIIKFLKKLDMGLDELPTDDGNTEPLSPIDRKPEENEKPVVADWAEQVEIEMARVRRRQMIKKARERKLGKDVLPAGFLTGNVDKSGRSWTEKAVDTAEAMAKARAKKEGKK